MQITKLLTETTGLIFPNDEVAYLALRIASITTTKDIKNNDYKLNIGDIVTEMIEVLISNIKDVLDVDLSRDKILRKNLKLHLESTLLRVMSGFYINNPLRNEIKNAYMQLFFIIQVILEEYTEKFGLIVPEEEIAYLTIHFKAALERNEKEEKHYNVLIACDYGFGVSAFLEAKINRHFPQINIVDLVSYQDLKETDAYDKIDFIISTNRKLIHEIPSLEISPLMEEQDINKIQMFMKEKPSKGVGGRFDIYSYTNPFLVEPNLDISNKEACLSFMCERLEGKGYVNAHYKNTVFRREENSSTRIGSLIAIPHGNTNHVQQSAICVVTLKEPIDWGDGDVQLILLLALKKEDSGLAESKKLFPMLNDLVENKTKLNQVLNEHDRSSIMKLLSVYK